jgi:hypothetical protein
VFATDFLGRARRKVLENLSSVALEKMIDTEAVCPPEMKPYN